MADAPAQSSAGAPCLVVIATILPRHGETGVQAHFNALYDHLVATGREVRFVNHRARLRIAAVPLLAARRLIDPMSGALSVWWYRQWHFELLRIALSSALADPSPMVVYAQCPLSALAALRARRSPDQKVVMAVHFSHSQADEWAAKGRIRLGSWVYRDIKRLDARVLRSLDGIVYLSRYMKEYLESDVPALRETRSATLPNFVSRAPGPRDRAVAGDLITIGALDTNKNQAYLLRVLAEARKLGRRYSLTVVGDGRERAKLERFSAELGVADQVRFLGSVPEARRLLPGYRAYVHSASMDNMPVSVIEALAAGLPVLAPAVGGIPELLDDGIEGFFWPLDDPAAGARKMIGMLEDEAVYQRTAKAVERRFATQLEKGVVAERLARFLCGEAGR